MRADADGVRVECWYEPRFHLDPDLARRHPKELAEQFGELFSRAAQRCLVSDVPVALLLSDRIDSNSIHQVLRETGRGVPSFTFTAVTEGAEPTLGNARADGTVAVRVPAQLRSLQAFSAAQIDLVAG